MKELYVLSLVLFIFLGCSEDKKESQNIETKIEPIIKVEKETFSTPIFHQDGELYRKGGTLADVAPHKVLEADGNVKDILLDTNKLYAGTDAGVIDIFDLTTDALIGKIKIPPFHDDIYNKEVVTTVYSIDKIGDKIVLLTSYKGVQKRLYIYENEQLIEIKDLDPNLMIIKVRFLDEHRVLLGLLSNELILYDVTEKKELYRTKLSESSFGDFALTNDKKEVVVGCESGMVYLVETQSGKLKTLLRGINKDKSYKVDIKNGLVLSAGQDSIGGLYNLNTNTFKTLKANFLIYAGILSADGSKAAYAFNEENEIIVVDTQENQKEAYLLKGQKSTLNAILFIDNKNLISASDDEFIMLWQLP